MSNKAGDCPALSLEWTVPVDGVIHMFFDKKKDDPKKKKPQSSPFRIAWMLSIKNRKYQLERHSNSSVVVF